MEPSHPFSVKCLTVNELLSILFVTNCTNRCHWGSSCSDRLRAVIILLISILYLTVKCSSFKTGLYEMRNTEFMSGIGKNSEIWVGLVVMRGI